RHPLPEYRILTCIFKDSGEGALALSSHIVSQYDPLISSTFPGCPLLSAPRLGDAARAWSPSRLSVRSCAQTTYSTEPGRYSHRSTVFERYCLKSNAPGSPPAYGSKREVHWSARGSATCIQFVKFPRVANGAA